MKTSTGIIENFIHMYLLENSHHAFIPLWVLYMCEFEICKFKRETVFGTIFLSYFESIDLKKKCIFQIRTYKVPIEEMTDR